MELMDREFFINNEKETRKAAKILAQEIIKRPLKTKGALVIGLEGELGSGKTTFIKAFAKGLGIRKRLTSPTFVLMKKYPIPKSIIHNLSPNIYLYHIDCYRVKHYKHILNLDFQEIISNPKNIIIIEWAEKIKRILPKDAIWLKFKIISERERRIKIKN